jgi:SAM-dependent methyltransferase
MSQTNNRITQSAYEQIAEDYACSTRGTPGGVHAALLRELALSVRPGGTILDIGSGPGWDADFLEDCGAEVRRTDATAAFCEFQTARGKHAEVVDVITDDLSTAKHRAYDGAVALCVFLHVERRDIDAVMQKVAASLRPGALFLVSVREGDGDRWEGDRDSRRYHVTLWREVEFESRLKRAGLAPLSRHRSIDDEGPWLTFVTAARRPSGTDSPSIIVAARDTHLRSFRA